MYTNLLFNLPITTNLLTANLLLNKPVTTNLLFNILVTCILVFKLLHEMIDTDIAKLNVTLSQNNTRAKGVNIDVNRARTAYVGKTFCFRIANL